MTNDQAGSTPPAWPAPTEQAPTTYRMPPRRRPWLPWVIAGGSVMLVGALVLCVIVVANFVVGLRPTGDPLLEGEAGPPVAEEPLVCTASCFDAGDIPTTQPGESALLYLGLDVTTFEWGTFDPMTAGELHRGNIPGWIDMGGYPDACFFVPGNTPASFTDSDDSTDEVQYTGTYADSVKLNTVEQAIRFFESSATAEAYMNELATNIQDCTLVEYGTGQDYYSAEVTPVPLLDLPPSVAAAGWIRTGDIGPRWRSYVVDLQRGNMVVRTRLLTDGSLTELEYRDLVESIAGQLEQIEPALPEG